MVDYGLALSGVLVDDIAFRGLPVPVDVEVEAIAEEADPGIGAYAADQDDVATFEVVDAQDAGVSGFNVGLDGLREAAETQGEVEVSGAGVLMGGEPLGAEGNTVAGGEGGLGEISAAEVVIELDGSLCVLLEENEGVIRGDDQYGTGGDE